MGNGERLPILQNADVAHAQREQASKRRRMRWLVLAGVIAAILISSIAFTRSTAATKTDESPFERVMTAYRAKTNFDGVVQVTINGKRVFDDWSGKANEEFNVSMTKQSIFPIGSNSKLFTSVAMYQLQERGLVNLTDSVTGWLNQSDFAAFGYANQTSWCPRLEGAAPDSPCESITFVQLMYMSSGIGDILNCDNVPSERCYRTANNFAYYKGSIGAHVGRFINDPLVFRPGSNYSYSNPNFILLSYMVEKISQQSFAAYLKEHITDKIGLKDTYFDPYSGGLGVHPGYVEQYIHYYAQDQAANQTKLLATGTCAPYMNSGALSGTGGIRSTTEDMHMWYLDLFQDRGRRSKVLTEQSIRYIIERRNPVNPMYGQGIGVVDFVDGWPKTIAYCGGMKCCTTCIGMESDPGQPEASVVASSFSNHNHMVFDSVTSFARFHPDAYMYMPGPDSGIVEASEGGAIQLRRDLLAVAKQGT